ncbi:MAG: NgoFVII family restriction endonuclease [Treponematales bacterium]
MPKIYDNIENFLTEGLNKTLVTAKRADFCVGYFNLRGWHILLDSVDALPGAKVTDSGGNTRKYHARLLIGMQSLPHEELETYFSGGEPGIDNKTALEKKKRLAADLRRQLTIGTPTNRDEETLRKLCAQLRSRRMVVKLHLAFRLHAKLYLAYRDDYNAPAIGFLGSSNLTFSGIQGQGELNIDVNDKDAAQKLANWFTDRWEDRWSLDITDELAGIIDESWASDAPRSPYKIYMKMIYHLARDALAGEAEFPLPRIFRRDLLPYQQNAVQVAAHHLYKRGGVMIGDVVGLGKTITAAALAKIFLDDYSAQTLILCPPKLCDMWESYNDKYQLSAKVMSQGESHKLKNMRRYQIVIIDESHNFRNSDGKRFNEVKTYIDHNASKVVLLTATPYNKSYVDMGSQLSLFLDEDAGLGIMPDNYIKKTGGLVQFEAKHQVNPSTLAAFFCSDDSQDWMELMRLFLVRRTRSFIKKYHAKTDNDGKPYIEFSDGRRQYFPDRKPLKVEYEFDPNDSGDQYAALYSEKCVNIINALSLPRYALGSKQYEDKAALKTITAEEQRIKDNLSKGGAQLVGFARTNLFKRLESSGYSFLLSLSRHILRNYLFIHCIENDLPFPVGQQDGRNLGFTDEDLEGGTETFITDMEELRSKAQEYYAILRVQEKRYDWIRSSLFNDKLKKDLSSDIASLMRILEEHKVWDIAQDRQLGALYDLIINQHPQEKVLVFTEFSDTANYLYRNLVQRGVKNIGCVTGDTNNVTVVTKQFSPKSNGAADLIKEELRVLISTDVLSEGQNLQDAHIVVNYDLPWAIIRLIQRAGRVDRIGQTAPEIFCYSFLPEHGIETIINLRGRLQKRLRENAETVGSEEVFFAGDPVNVADLYSEKTGILDEAESLEVDLSSYCAQIWKKAAAVDSTLEREIKALPNVVYATKKATESESTITGEFAAFSQDLTSQPEGGVVVYAETADGSDNITWIGEDGNVATQSYYNILRAVECEPNEPALPKMDNHHCLVQAGVKAISEASKKIGGQLGRQTGVRYRVYTKLTAYLERNKDSLFATDEIKRAHQDIHDHPLTSGAKESLGRALKSGASDETLAMLAVNLRAEGKLTVTPDREGVESQPAIICSMGLDTRGGA